MGGGGGGGAGGLVSKKIFLFGLKIRGGRPGPSSGGGRDRQIQSKFDEWKFFNLAPYSALRSSSCIANCNIAVGF